MYKIFFGLGVLVATTCAATAAMAQGSLLFVSPHRLIIGPDDRTQVVSVANQSNEERSYEIRIVDQVMNERGITERVDTFPYSAKRMLRYVPRKVTLAPGERQVVRVMARRPRDLADGDYHSHLLFKEIPSTSQATGSGDANADAGNKVSFEIGTVYGVGIPVIVRHGDVVAEMEVTDAAISQASNGDDRLQLTLKHGGNAEAAAYMKFFLRKEGAEPVQIATPRWVRLYREVDTVVKDIQFTLPEGYNSLKDGELVIKAYSSPNENTAEELFTRTFNL